MAKKMNDEEMLETMEQAVKMHFMAFQQFMKQTGGDISLSLQLTTSYMVAMLKGSQEQNEKEEKLLKMHKLALLMEDIARASVSAVVGLFMLGVAIVIGIIVLVTIMTVLKMAINDISEFFKKIARRR